MLSEMATRSLGSIYTPPDFADFLTRWAIRSPSCSVLDLGLGEGAFVFAAYQLMLELGANPKDAQNQLYGAEVDQLTFSRFQKLAESIQARFPNLHNASFFEISFPHVDAIVGNPPYVRRMYMEEVDHIRQSVVEKNTLIRERSLSRLTDLYVYFLMHALPFLKPGGRLAVITADSWLNTSYGVEFKEYLVQNFEIEHLICLDRPIFDEAQVKPVMILASKKESANTNYHVDFVRVKNGLPVNMLQQFLSKPDANNVDIVHFGVKASALDAGTPWGIHFKAPEIYQQLAEHRLMTPIANLAQTRIGLQTLAKDFFVLTPEQAKVAQIEKRFLEPLAQSSKYFSEPTLESDTLPNSYVFHCSKTHAELRNTHALKYILKAESSRVQVRGKGITVVGYQNKDRIKHASRPIWYDLKTSLERRGRAQILIPRLLYRTFMVIWNKAGFVPGELFIEFIPLPETKADVEVYLAILTSSITEIMLRTSAQVYGGGTYNIKPGHIKNVPILDVRLLTKQQKQTLKRAYLQYLTDKQHDRAIIDSAMSEILDLDNAVQQKLKEVLDDLITIATSSKKPGHSARKPSKSDSLSSMSLTHF